MVVPAESLARSFRQALQAGKSEFERIENYEKEYIKNK